MKRVFVVFREFSTDGTEFSPIMQFEVFTTLNRAKEFALKYAGLLGNNIVSEQKDCFEFAYRMTYKCESGNYIRFTIVGRNINNNY